VASRIGGFAELLQDGVHGHLVQPDDVAGLAAALAHCVADRGFAAGCSRRALALSEGGADWTTIARRTAGVYQEAIALAGVSTVGRSLATEVSSNMRKSTGGNC
jgi:glycosyltransferase involved in cell wall biosynthesis